MVESIDRQIVHALQIDGRAPFARVAEVLGVSEHTVARRYRKLREAKAIRVVGALNGILLGHHAWTIRLRCTPDVGAPLAAALAKRKDTHWVHLLSGGTEISCYQQTESDTELLLDKLPRSVLDVSAQSVLRGFVAPSTWSGLACLDDDQIEHLKPRVEPEQVELTDSDHALIDLLNKDGRMGYAELAHRAGTSESTARRRVEHLRKARVLDIQLDADPKAFGYAAEARLWMTAPPAKLAEVGANLATHPEVYFAAATTGRAGLVASVVCRDSLDLYRYLTERIGPNVNEVESAPVLRTVKRN
ncbi:AsnC family transcriptional regulator [Lentzea sp. NBRC 105346]|uniref:Lrp/AsnC family transcriptional regulator n=1 Tax=Lentzea sp. NBRC 105346 TaxID=3032205 RepID=UPI0024A10488|nr:AsnC family transcriptional regulator [Lentzea sp. NBRC 105346]GLZ29503.1 AsnC family transcriptional regulator [Lentzea sp. NBRC 105346]